MTGNILETEQRDYFLYSNIALLSSKISLSSLSVTYFFLNPVGTFSHNWYTSVTGKACIFAETNRQGSWNLYGLVICWWIITYYIHSEKNPRPMKLTTSTDSDCKKFILKHLKLEIDVTK